MKKFKNSIRKKLFKKFGRELIWKIEDFVFFIPRTFSYWRRRLYHEVENLKNWYVFDKKRGGIYYYYSSTDCDLCTREGYDRVRTEKQYRRVESDLWENAEGATHISKCSAADYFEYYKEGGYMTDHILQAFENGDGRKVII